MSSRVFTVIVVIVVVLVLGAAAAGGGYFLYRQQQSAAWLADGNAHFESGNYNLARASYGLYLNRHPDDQPILRKYAKSSKLIVDNRRFALAQAATALNQTLRYTEPDDPDRPELVEEIFEVYRAIEAWGDLLFFAEQEIARTPDDTQLLFNRAEALYKLGKFDQAEEGFNAIKDRPDAPAEVFGYLADLLYDRRLNAAATAVLDEAVAAHPDDCGVWVARGTFRRSHNYSEGAREDFEAALKANADCVKALLEIAMMEVGARSFESAIEYADRAIALDPKQHRAYMIKSHALQQMGRMDEAADLLANVDFQIAVDHPPMLLSLAEMYLGLDRLDDAKAVVDSYMKSYPAHTLVQDYFTGRYHLAEDRIDEAIAILSIVYNEQPRFSPAHYYLIVAYLAADRREDARNTLEAYLRTYPRDASARALVAREYGRYQDPDQLRDLARRELSDPGATAASLASAGTTLITSIRGANRDDETVSLATDLFREAIRRGPDVAIGYAALADLQASQGGYDAARQTIQKGINAGIAETELALSEANIDILSGDVERAVERAQSQLADTDVDGRIEWASFFTARGLLDAAESVLKPGIASADGLNRARLQMEYLRVCARASRIEEVGSLVEELNAIMADQPVEAKGRYAEVKTDVIGVLLRNGSDAEITLATSMARSVVDESPEDAEARILLAECLAQSSPPKFEEARSLIASIPDSDQKSPRALMALSSLALAKGDSEAALDYATQLAVIAPAYIRGQLRLAEVHLEMGNLEDAEASLETALDISPDVPELLGLLADVYMREGLGRRADETLRRLDRVAGSDPLWADTLARLQSQYQLIAGEAKEAEATLREQYAANPDDLSAAAALADNLLRQARGDESIALLRAWADEHPTIPDGWNALARAYLSQGSDEGLWSASTALTRVLVLDPENESALREMVDVQQRLKNFTDATLIADRLLALRPNDDDMLYRKAAMITRDRGRYEEALSLISRAISISDDPRYRGLRGFIRLELGNFSGALEDLEIAAAARGVSSGQLDLALAECYLGVAQFDRAHQFYGSAVEKAEQGESLNMIRLERVEGQLGADTAP